MNGHEPPEWGEVFEALGAFNQAERTRARMRLDVSRDVRQAIYQAQSRALLALRDRQRINDLVHAELQLELDRGLPRDGNAV